jgi:hypothetical protein
VQPQVQWRPIMLWRAVISLTAFTPFAPLLRSRIAAIPNAAH